jgi:hypothetical protein
LRSFGPLDPPSKPRHIQCVAAPTVTHGRTYGAQPGLASPSRFQNENSALLQNKQREFP